VDDLNRCDLIVHTAKPEIRHSRRRLHAKHPAAGLSLGCTRAFSCCVHDHALGSAGLIAFMPN
jgi:hypothetical protein